MGWIDPVVVYAAPARLSDPEPRHVGAGAIEDRADRRWELIDTAVSAGELDLDGCEALEVDNSTLDGVTFIGGTMASVSLSHSVAVGCDLSAIRFLSLRNVRLDDCKLVGADFAGGDLVDVSFKRCVLRLVNLRNVKLRRVQFIDCTLHDVDAFDLDAEDVSFAGSDLETFNMDRLRARRVDLRATRQLGLTKVTGLNGCLVEHDQLLALRYQMAFAAGLDIERQTDPD